MLSAAMTRIQEALFEARSSGPTPVPPVESRRAGVEAMAHWGAAADGVAINSLQGTIAGVRLITPERSRGEILYVHGGGYFGGSHRSHARMVSHIVRATGRAATMVDYRLAPEHPYPAALEDVIAAYKDILGRGEDDIVLVGDSAGGGLALAAAMRIRDLTLPTPRAVAMLSPWLDLAEHRVSLDTDPVCSGEGLNWNREAYLSGHDPRDPYVSPLFGDLSGLPPLYVQVDAGEMLRRDTARLEEALAAAHPPLVVRETHGLVHTFQLAAGNAPEADEAIRDLAAWIETTEH